MSRRFLRNSETDFRRWCRDYVNEALDDVHRFENRHDMILFKEDYVSALEIVRQYVTIKCALPEEYRHFLDEELIGKDAPGPDRETFPIYREVFQTWQEVCFPKAKPEIRAVNAFRLGHHLRAERIERCMSVKQVAELISVSPKTLYAYEEGTRRIRVDVLNKLSQLYEISIDRLLEKS